MGGGSLCAMDGHWLSMWHAQHAMSAVWWGCHLVGAITIAVVAVVVVVVVVIIVIVVVVVVSISINLGCCVVVVVMVRVVTGL